MSNPRVPPPRSPTLAVVVVGALQAACGSGSTPPSLRPGRPGAPDVVLISIDSLRPDHLGCYGYPKPTSPTIDRLASEGVRCEVAVSTTSWTLPAHAAMLTGLYDSAHGVVDNGLSLSPARVTLPEVLSESDWDTAGFYGGPYLAPIFGLDQGFARYESCMSPEAGSSHQDVTGPRTVDAVERWLGETVEKGERRPFFLFIHLWDVHYDYKPPARYVEMFDPGYAGTLDASDFPHNPAIAPDMAPADLQHLVALYDGEIRFTDEIVGRILEAIDRRGRLRDALVIVTADHGEEFFEHGGKGHQKTLFDEVVRIPLIVRWPGRLQAGTLVRDQVRLVDLAPTILSLAGITQRPPMQGRDISPLLRGEPMTPEPALIELLVDRNDIRGSRGEAEKVISWRHAGTSFLYDLVRDPGEAAPIAEPSPRLSAALQRLQRELERTSGFARESQAGRVEIAPDLARRLGVLGYAGEPLPAPDPRGK
ncbi:MAG: sulfatase [Planctomycetota bacterium]